jgi:hypothetical protein
VASARQCLRLDRHALASYLVAVLGEPIIATSAYKHGLSQDDILHAYRNPIRVWDLGDGFTMIVGPNRAAIILEVGYVAGDVAVVIVHAMPAREKFVR